MDHSVDRLLLEYLAQVGDAAQQHLPPQRRPKYIGDVRQRIEKERDAAKVSTEAEMRRVLGKFGDPEDLVARDCAPVSGGDDEGGSDRNRRRAPRGRRTIGILARPVSYKRAPPPWKGGPRRTQLHHREATGASRSPLLPPRHRPVEGVLGRFSLGVVFVRIANGARRHPLDVAAVVLYLLAGLIAQLTFLWPLAAAQVAFSKAWRHRDKWVALGVPLAATSVGMALWPGEAPYIDLVLQQSFLDTGIWGLRAAAVACAFYLGVRMSRIVAHERMQAGQFPVTGDTPFGSSSGKSSKKPD